MNTQSNTPFYLDKGLYVAILGMFLPVLSAKLGVPLDGNKIATIITFGVTFIVAHKAKSGAVLLAEIKQRALATVTTQSQPENK